MKKTILAAAILGAASLMATSASADVVTSLKPLAFISAEIANGVTGTKVLVTGNQSPHDFELTPKALADMKSADIFVFVSDDMEISIAQALENSNYRPKNVLELGDLPGIKEMLVKGVHIDHDEDAEEAEAMAKGGDHHDHDHMDKDNDHDHDHNHMDKDEDHDHDHMDNDDDHDHEMNGTEDHHHHHHHHHHDENGLVTNYHIWNSPVFAKVIAKSIAEQLTVAYPDKKELIAKNLATFDRNLDTTVAKVRRLIVPTNFDNYLVYHDAYTYFEKDFGIDGHHKGAIYFNVAIPPSIKTLNELHQTAVKDDIKVIFTEPQFNQAIARKLADSIHARVGTLDPLGSTIPVQPGSYSTYLIEMARQFDAASKQPATSK